MPPLNAPDLRLRVIPAIAEVDAAAWDTCANPGLAAPLQPESEETNPRQSDTSEFPYNPFISYDFLHSLEASDSATARTGWQPQHLLAETTGGQVLGVTPCYLKSHSRGEYVFDRGWAEAYERAGGEYYPKLQVSVPFTPATGRRLLVAPAHRSHEIEAALAQGLVELARLREASSAHVTFMLEPEWHVLAERGFLQRTDQQFHWENAGYATFDDFLGALASRKRKVLKRERREALA